MGVLYLSKTRIYTTGVLNNVGSLTAIDTHIEVFNLDDHSHSITIDVYNWDTAENEIGSGPTLIPVFHGTTFVPGNKVHLQPNRWVLFDSIVSGIEHYEVRITVHSDKVIANVFGRATGGTAIDAQSVLFSELARVDLDD
jgi:hypothetical protein